MPPCGRKRLDVLLVERGLAGSRERAQALISIADPKFRDELSAAARKMALI